MTDIAARMTAESFLSRLAERGIEYVLANAGTDFAPIIEALSRNPGSNRKYPRVITVPHENVAVSMAHGYYRVSGKLRPPGTSAITYILDHERGQGLISS